MKAEKIAVIMWVLILAILLLSWVVNFSKLMSCDFEAPFKCEVAHAVGLAPLASVVTVWFDTDE